MTSYDVIRRIKKFYPNEKIGHGGTLDRAAEGILVIGIGRPATKKLSRFLKNSTKVYRAKIVLGKTSTTDDSEGNITVSKNKIIPNDKRITDILKKFTGKHRQIPPRYSAVKIRGRRASDMARRGIILSLKAKQVEIKKIKLISYQYPDFFIETSVSSGTYIRSLARDIGRKLQTGAYLDDLLRTQVGPFDLKKAVDLNDLEKYLKGIQKNEKK